MSEAKAKELIDKADKKLKSWLSFGGNKYEDAEELYTKAANQLKVAKQCALTPRALRSLHIRCAYGRVLLPLLTPVPFAVTPRRGRCGRRF